MFEIDYGTLIFAFGYILHGTCTHSNGHHAVLLMWTRHLIQKCLSIRECKLKQKYLSGKSAILVLITVGLQGRVSFPLIESSCCNIS